MLPETKVISMNIPAHGAGKALASMENRLLGGCIVHTIAAGTAAFHIFLGRTESISADS